MRLGQKDGTARQSGRFADSARTEPPALETDPPSTTNAFFGAAIRRLFVLVWFGLVPYSVKATQTPFA